MASKIFSTPAYGDAEIRAFRRESKTPFKIAEPYDIIILDEFQDCTEDLFWLAYSLISSITHAAGGRGPQIVALGDERQAIYDFRGADSRYLSLLPSIMPTFSCQEWARLPLSKSFRLSRETACFVNEVFLDGENYITGTHSGPKPIYIHADLFQVGRLSEELVPLVKHYGPERTAILAPSIRQNGPLAIFTNLLSEKYRIPVAVSVSDEVSLDDRDIRGKVCVSTYHQFKGNERDLVIVYGAEADYFDYFGRDLPNDKCPNTIFVALTRAIKQLVVLHSHQKAPMPFISLSSLSHTAQYVNISGKDMTPQKAVGRPQELGLLLPSRVWVSDMARHIPDVVLEAIIETYVNVNLISPPLPESKHIKAPDRTLTNKIKMTYEAVSDLNGIAVVAAFEYAQTGQIRSFKIHKSKLQIPLDKGQQAAWFSRAACEYDAQTTGYRSRKVQLERHKFDWLDSHLHEAVQRLKDQFGASEHLEFESRLELDEFEVIGNDHEPQKTKIIGRADIVVYDTSRSNNTILSQKAGPRCELEEHDACLWEIKFVAKLTLEHVAQACAYAYLWAIKYGLSNLPRVILFNVRDGEKREITCPYGISGARRLIEEILRAKYSTTEEDSIDEFLERCQRTIGDVEKLWRKPRASKENQAGYLIG
ncbi:hypothetical protein AAE478_001463 [Parahypoxylon ruwenzoriense]